MSNQPKEYIELDSTYRDRERDPNPAQFTVLMGCTGNQNNGLNAISPVSNEVSIFPPITTPGLAYYTDNTQTTANMTRERLYLPFMYQVPAVQETLIRLDELPLAYTELTASDIPAITATFSAEFPAGVQPLDTGNNAYVGDFLEHVENNEFREIISSRYQTITTVLQQGVVALYTNASIGSTVFLREIVTGVPTPSNVDRFYQGKQLTITSGTLSGASRVILNSYVTVGDQTALIVSSGLDGLTDGDTFNITTDRSWFVEIASPFSTSLPLYPAYQDTLPDIYETTIASQVIIEPTDILYIRIITSSTGQIGIGYMTDANTVLPDYGYPVANLSYISSADVLGEQWYSKTDAVVTSSNILPISANMHFGLTTNTVNDVPVLQGWNLAGRIAGYADEWDGISQTGLNFESSTVGFFRTTFVAADVGTPVVNYVQTVLLVTNIIAHAFTDVDGTNIRWALTSSSSGANPTTIYSPGVTGYVMEVILGISDFPIIYYQQLTGELYAVAATNTSGTAWGAAAAVNIGSNFDTDGVVSALLSSVNNLSAILYSGLAPDDSVFIHQSAGGVTFIGDGIVIASTNIVKTAISLTQDTVNNDLWAFYARDTGLYLRVFELNPVNGSIIAYRVPEYLIDPATGITTLDTTINSAGYPVVAYNGSASGDSTQLNTVMFGQRDAEAGVHYRIRKEIPTLSGTWTPADANPSPFEFILSASASSIDDAYVGSYIGIRNYESPTLIPATSPDFYSFNDYRLIRSYDGATRTGTVTQAFSADLTSGGYAGFYGPNYVEYEILAFNRDSFQYLNYFGTQASMNQQVCYELELLNLVLPNKTLITGVGNLIAFYPYVYVEFVNMSNMSGPQNFYSNNPSSSRMLFRVPVTNVNSPDRAAFVFMDGRGMRQTIKFKPNDNFRFSVYLSNGELFTTAESDSVPPAAPIFDLQVSALFGVRRLAPENQPGCVNWTR